MTPQEAKDLIEYLNLNYNQSDDWRDDKWYDHSGNSYSIDDIVKEYLKEKENGN